jgi:hypothetical protein
MQRMRNMRKHLPSRCLRDERRQINTRQSRRVPRLSRMRISVPTRRNPSNRVSILKLLDQRLHRQLASFEKLADSIFLYNFHFLD